MNVRIALIALAAAFAVATPAAAQSLNPWGMWGEGGKMKKQKSQSSLFYSPRALGAPPSQVKPSRGPNLMSGGPKPSIAAKKPATVSFRGYKPGTVVIDTKGRKLYYVTSSTTAYSYPVTVGKTGFTWSGTQKVSRIASWPDWHPPEEMRKRKPSLPKKMTGGVRNPLGARAIYLGSTLYRIHGTNNAKSIGQAASSGCFRMHNAHVVHLARLVKPGTTVHVLRGSSKKLARATSGQPA